MKITTKIFLILFAFYSVLFGSTLILLEYLFNCEIIILKDVLSSIIFAAVMAAFNVNSKIHLRKNKRKPIEEEDFHLSHNEYIETDLSMDEIYTKLKGCILIKKIRIDIKNQIVTAKTKFSFFSFGERISISKIDNKTKIKSRTILRIPLLINNKNIKNVAEIVKTIE